MSEIVKRCPKHGDLTIDQVNQEKRDGLTFRLRCKKCINDYYLKNLEKRRAYSKEYEATKRIRPKNHYEEVVRPKSREWRRRNADKVNERVAKDRELNPEKYREYDRKWRRENIDLVRDRDVLKKFEIDYESYKLMFEQQGHVCAICKNPETRKSRTPGNVCRLAIDHCHSTNKIRGLLCHACNIILGKAKDSIEILESAIAYLKKADAS